MLENGLQLSNARIANSLSPRWYIEESEVVMKVQNSVCLWLYLDDIETHPWQSALVFISQNSL